MKLKHRQKFILMLLVVMIVVVFSLVVILSLKPVIGCLANQIRAADGSCVPWSVTGLSGR